MLTIGDKFPSYKLEAVTGTEPGKEFTTLSDESHPGKWKVIFFWPMDFTFVCPTEIAAFGELDQEFSERNVQVLGASTDSHFVHLAWRRQHPDLEDLPFPMLADTKRTLCEDLGILHPEEGVALRATFIVDPKGIIRHVSVNDLDVGRNPDEILRLVDAFQTGELTPCNWKKGSPTLTAA